METIKYIIGDLWHFIGFLFCVEILTESLLRLIDRIKGK